MSKRLQVVMEDGEYFSLQQAAATNKLSVGEFVRQRIRQSIVGSDAVPADVVLKALERALQCNAPTADIEQMNAEIEAGYAHGLP